MLIRLSTILVAAMMSFKEFLLQEAAIKLGDMNDTIVYTGVAINRDTYMSKLKKQARFLKIDGKWHMWSAWQGPIHAGVYFLLKQVSLPHGSSKYADLLPIILTYDDGEYTIEGGGGGLRRDEELRAIHIWMKELKDKLLPTEKLNLPSPRPI